jgi:hypothetical protein
LKNRIDFENLQNMMAMMLNGKTIFHHWNYYWLLETHLYKTKSPIKESPANQIRNAVSSCTVSFHVLCAGRRTTGSGSGGGK